jgi:hypothetical protein
MNEKLSERTKGRRPFDHPIVEFTLCINQLAQGAHNTLSSYTNPHSTRSTKSKVSPSKLMVNDSRCNDLNASEANGHLKPVQKGGDTTLSSYRKPAERRKTHSDLPESETAGIVAVQSDKVASLKHMHNATAITSSAKSKNKNEKSCYNMGFRDMEKKHNDNKNPDVLNERSVRTGKQVHFSTLVDLEDKLRVRNGLKGTKIKNTEKVNPVPISSDTNVKSLDQKGKKSSLSSTEQPNELGQRAEYVTFKEMETKLKGRTTQTLTATKQNALGNLP